VRRRRHGGGPGRTRRPSSTSCCAPWLEFCGRIPARLEHAGRGDSEWGLSMTERHNFRVLIAYPNLSMMLTPSYAVALFTTVLKQQGYDVDLFDCTPYLARYEFLKEPLPVTRANKLFNSRKFDAKSLFGDPKMDLTGDFARKLDEYKPQAVVFSTLVEDTWPQAKELLEVNA